MFGTKFCLDWLLSFPNLWLTGTLVLKRTARVVCLSMAHQGFNRGGRDDRKRDSGQKWKREGESFLKICIETQKMARTFDGWMEFAVKWDQAVIVENLKTFPEKFVEDKHRTERKCLSMTNDLWTGSQTFVHHSYKRLSEKYMEVQLIKGSGLSLAYPNVTQWPLASKTEVLRTDEEANHCSDWHNDSMERFSSPNIT